MAEITLDAATPVRTNARPSCDANQLSKYFQALRQVLSRCQKIRLDRFSVSLQKGEFSFFIDGDRPWLTLNRHSDKRLRVVGTIHPKTLDKRIDKETGFDNPFSIQEVLGALFLKDQTPITLEFPSGYDNKTQVVLTRTLGLGTVAENVRKSGPLSHVHTLSDQFAAAVAELPAAKRKAVLARFSKVYGEMRAPDLPPPDASGKKYKLLPKGADALKHLKTHWGKYLKRFTPELERDLLFQDQLNERDARLVQAVRNQLNREIANKKRSCKQNMSFYVPPKRIRLDYELQESNEIPELEISARLQQAQHRRKKK